MTRRGGLLSALALALIALAAFWFLRSFDWVEREVELPPRGEARYNPLYGLGRALGEAGFDVSSRASFDPDAMALAAGDVVLLATDLRTLGEDEADALHDWVDRGGRLVFVLPPADDQQQVPLLQWFGIALTADPGCAQIDAAPAIDATADEGPEVDAEADADAYADADADKDGSKPFSRFGSGAPTRGDRSARDAVASPVGTERAETDGNDAGGAIDSGDASRNDDPETPARLCGDARIVEADDEAWLWSWPLPDGGALAVRAQHDDGQWLALPTFDFLQRRALRREGNAALAWTLFEPLLGAGRVHLVYSTDIAPLHVLLARHGWPILLPLLLMLLAWLWRRSQRLGPALPLPGADRRALLEHVRAAGEFAFRRGRGEVLHAALKRRFDARLAREFPALAALSGDDQVLALAAAWQLDSAWVRQALRPRDLKHPDAYTDAIRSLSRLQTLP